jgi:hypothetical protein
MLAGLLFKDSTRDVRRASIEAISVLCQYGVLLIPC